VKEKPNMNLPYTGRLLLDIVRSRVMMSARGLALRTVLRKLLPLWFIAAAMASEAGMLITPRNPIEY
jgi:hypothetical protein